tara:strand:- start:280 stop:837 length:558 start_codon:yes stop_codon:yes gene_type:complete
MSRDEELFGRGEALFTALSYLNPYSNPEISESITTEQMNNAREALYQLLEEHNNPHITTMWPGENPNPFFKRANPRIGGPDSLFINMNNRFEDLIAELSHAKQFMGSPSLRDSLSKEARRQKKLYGKGTYHVEAQKGSGAPTVEYQAHEMIEPTILNRFLEILGKIDKKQTVGSGGGSSSAGKVY